MKLNSIIYDVYEVLRVHSKDKDFNEELMARKINAYRAMLMDQAYARNGYLNQVWYQNHHPISMQKVTSGDDPLIALGSITLGKGTITPPVYFSADSFPPVTITTGSRQMPFSPIEPEILMNLIISGEEIHPNYGYFFIRESNLYTYPYKEKMTGSGIFSEPQLIQVPNAGYTAWRERTLEDDYPVDIGMAQEIVLQILVKDYSISMKQISDLLNDGQTKLSTIPSHAVLQK